MLVIRISVGTVTAPASTARKHEYGPTYTNPHTGNVAVCHEATNVDIGASRTRNYEVFQLFHVPEKGRGKADSSKLGYPYQASEH